jgi:hypothetical protein
MCGRGDTFIQSAFQVASSKKLDSLNIQGTSQRAKHRLDRVSVARYVRFCEVRCGVAWFEAGGHQLEKAR